MERLLGDQAELYATVYFGMIAAVALAEWLQPRRAPGRSQGTRWFGNFALTIIGAVLVRAIFPVVGVGWALVCEQRQIGLLHQVSWPAWVGLLLTVVVADLSYYMQHYLLHRVPLLWRLHRTHHSDHEYDFSTGVRFHPFEAVYTTAVIMLVIAVLGASPFAVLIWQALSVAVAFVEHANLRIPAAIDRVVRLVFVTPDMHRIHHSEDTREGNSNFSNMLSIWDRLFGTYIDQPAAGHDGIVFGVAELTEPRHQRLHWMLAQPFLRSRRDSKAEPRTPNLEPRTGNLEPRTSNLEPGTR